MIYRLHHYDDYACSWGFSYFSSRRRAERALRDWQRQDPGRRDHAAIESADQPQTTAELLRLLEVWAGHPDNG